MDHTLVPRIVMPDGSIRTFSLVFRGYRCVSVDETPATVCAHHPVALEGPYDAWREMIESIAAGGRGPWPSLGLAMANKIVNAHGGSIDVDSTVGSGSTFAVRLPKRESDRGRLFEDG